MNLLEERWIPVRLLDGSREWAAPHELAGPQIAAFDAARADFNGALAQFAIGLLQTTTPVDSNIEWRGLLKSPPDTQTLQSWFSPHSAAFDFDGDGARFMQDFDLRASDGEALCIGNLLIDAPGEKTVEDNGDHFVKRARVCAMCPRCAATALFTLNLNGPAGGQGHRTGLRGGGPLTTLLIADGQSESVTSLWQTLWLNVCLRGRFLDASGDAYKSKAHFTFPWCASIRALMDETGEIAPTQVHPAHVFWSMPRRIRLDFDIISVGDCNLCGASSMRLITQYVSRMHGLNYKGQWSHPLTPYQEFDGEMTPVHLQPDGLGYRDWLGWTLGIQSGKQRVERARAIEHFFEAALERKLGIGLRVWAFGYDMKSMKARCWYEATVPLYGLADCDIASQKRVREDVGAWLSGAEQAAYYLRGAVKDAWFSHTARGKFDFIDASFWGQTATAFYDLLRNRIQSARDGTEPDHGTVGETWLSQLRNVALNLFRDELVGTGPIERMNPARVAAAHNQLKANLNGPKLRIALALPVEAKPKKTSKQSQPGPAANAP